MMTLNNVATLALGGSALGFLMVLRQTITGQPPSISLALANLMLCLINAMILYLGSRL